MLARRKLPTTTNCRHRPAQLGDVGDMEAVTSSSRGRRRDEQLPGDYVYGNYRGPFREAGQWGVFRVREAGPAGVTPLRALPGRCSPPGACASPGSGKGLALPAGLGAALFLGLVGLGAGKRRRDEGWPQPRHAEAASQVAVYAGASTSCTAAASSPSLATLSQRLSTFPSRPTRKTQGSVGSPVRFG